MAKKKNVRPLPSDKRRPQPISISSRVVADRRPDFAGLGFDRRRALIGNCAMYGGTVDYGLLDALAQNGLIRAGVQAIADAMTSEWITLTHPGDGKEDADDDILDTLRDDMNRFGLQDVFAQAYEMIGLYGGCLVYIDQDIRASEELSKKAAFNRESIKRFTVVEPKRVDAGKYDTNNPLSPDYFRPEFWRVGNVQIHRSHFLYFSSGALPVDLRQAYRFFGIPQTQLLADAVMDFNGSKRSVLRLLEKVSRIAFKTSLSDTLSGGNGSDLDRRMQLLAHHWTNDDIAMIDKDGEDFVQITGNIAGVIDIVRFCLEQLPALFRIPVMKYLGITPSGLNATGDADLRNFYGNIGTQQERLLNKPLEMAIQVIQKNRFGRVDPAISFEWNPLGEKTDQEVAQITDQKVNTLSTLKNDGAISTVEYRQALRKIEGLGLEDIDPEEVPELEETGFGESLFGGAGYGENENP